MNDGHERATIHLANGVDLSGQGWISFRPHLAEYALFTGTANGSDTFLELLGIGSVHYSRSGSPAERATAKWEREIMDRYLTGPSEYLLGVPKQSGAVRPAITIDSIAGANAWEVKVDAPEGLEELWVRQSDSYLLQYRLTTPGGDVTTLTVDQYNTKPTLTVPPDSLVTEGKVTCGLATRSEFKPEIRQRLCGLEALGAPYEAVDFATRSTLPQSLTPYVVDYAAHEARNSEGVTLTGGAAVFKSESSAHEVDLVYSQNLVDLAVVADYEQTGAADASIAGISVRCAYAEDTGGQDCLSVGVRPDGHFQLLEMPPGGGDYKTVLRGEAKVNPGKNRLVVWADGDQIGIALNGMLLGTYTTANRDAAQPFFLHESLSETEPSQVRLLYLGVYQRQLLTMAQLMGT